MTNARKTRQTNHRTGFVLRGGIAYIPEFQWDSTMTTFEGIPLTALVTAVDADLNAWGTLFRLANGYEVMAACNAPTDQSCAITVTNPSSGVATSFAADRWLTPPAFLVALGILSETFPDSHNDERWLMPIVEIQVAALFR